MKKLTLTNNTVSKQTTITKKMKEINTMKKLILTTCLMVSAAFASFAGVIYNGIPGGQAFFTLDSDGSYYIDFGSRYYMTEPTVVAFGYYYVNAQGEFSGSFISGTLTGNPGNFFNGREDMSSIAVVDTNTGYLGDFKAGDTIGIWLVRPANDGTIITGTETYQADTLNEWTDYGLFPGAYYIPGGGSTYFHLYGVDAPAGEPLPGVLAALAIGGAAFLGRKIKGRAKRSN